MNYVDPSGNWPETESHIVRTDHVPVADWSNATRTSHAPERPSLDDWLSEMAVKLAVSSKKRQMERELEKNMKAAQAASQSTGCFEAVVVADSVLSFLMSMTLGAVGAVIENGTALVRQPKNFVQDVTGQARDKTMLDLMRDLSTNSLGFEIGRLIGDLASIMIGYHTTLLGLGILVASGATGQIQVTPAGIVIVAEEVAITISGALDTADALGAVEVELSKATSPGGSKPENEDEGDSEADLGDYKFKEGIDEDLRGGKGTFKEALDKAFEKTGTPKEDFEVTKWGRDQYGKSHPVEWRAPNGAEVSVDIGHPVESGAPTADHVGWQTGGKRGSGGGVRGHIFVDEVPYNR